MTVTIAAKAQFDVRGTTSTGAREAMDPEALSAHLDLVMDALLELEETGCGISDSSIAAELSSGEVEVEVLATGATYEEAEEVAISCVRTAIHKAGGATPRWSGDFRVQNRQSELVAV